MADALKAYYIPNGPKNLETIFPDIDWNRVAEYHIEILHGGDTLGFSTTNNLIDGECCADKFRIQFLQDCGAVDGINMKKLTKEHEVKSSRYQVSTKHPLQKPTHAHQRFNVKANDIFTLFNHDYREEDMSWIEELVHSPMAWMEWKGTQNQPDSYIPIIILDTKLVTFKFEERYIYEVQIQATLSHERYIIRN